MPGKVFSSPKVTVNGTDLSSWADKATVSQTLGSADITTFGATNSMKAPTLGDATITVDFFTDYATSGPNQTLSAMFTNSRNNVTGTVEIIPVGATGISATNPRITMPAAFLMNYTGGDFAVADASKFSAEFQNGGTAGITFGTV
jgi:hypothetical protein